LIPSIIILAIVIIVVVLIFRKEKIIQPQTCQVIKTEEVPLVLIDQEQVLFDEDGKKYINKNRTREIPRKTYLFGTINGKYWGELDQQKKQEYEFNKFYDFNIYEIEIRDTIHQPIPFKVTQDANFPRERLPSTLPITFKKDGKEYDLNIYEPQLRNVKFNRRLHQDEGNETFGTIDAEITGYVLDFVTEKYIEKVYVQQHEETGSQKINTNNDLKTPNTSGNIEVSGNYKRIEYYYSDFKTKYWGNWIYTKPASTPPEEGCLSMGIGLIGAIIGVVFLLLLLPRLVILLPFFLIPLLFSLIPAGAWTWILRIIGIILLLAFIFSMVYFFNDSRNHYLPKPVVQERSEEQNQQNIPIVDTIQNQLSTDTLITHFRSWKDYEGHFYEGKFWVKKSAFANARNYKNNLSALENSENSYDKIIYLLKENDRQNLNGIYQLFDSLKRKNNFSDKSFAETIVCFVQDIPYTVVLPSNCDPNLYADEFIKHYLSNKNASCDGNEKFGINTPVEFMATLKGDCDTRTLLLYTILCHYNYDVVLMSSEFYSHSIIGINSGQTLLKIQQNFPELSIK